MADEVKPEGAPKEPEAPKDKQYSKEEFDTVVKQRQELKEKLRAIEEEKQKAEDAKRKQDEEKMKEEGKLAELLKKREEELQARNAELEEARKQADAYAEQQKKLRDSLVSKLPEEDREFAADIKDMDRLEKLVTKLTNQSTVKPFSDNGKPKPPGGSTEPKSMAEAMEAARKKGIL